LTCGTERLVWFFLVLTDFFDRFLLLIRLEVIFAFDLAAWFLIFLFLALLSIFLDLDMNLYFFIDLPRLLDFINLLLNFFPLFDFLKLTFFLPKPPFFLSLLLIFLWVTLYFDFLFLFWIKARCLAINFLCAVFRCNIFLFLLFLVDLDFSRCICFKLRFSSISAKLSLSVSMSVLSIEFIMFLDFWFDKTKFESFCERLEFVM